VIVLGEIHVIDGSGFRKTEPIFWLPMN